MTAVNDSPNRARVLLTEDDESARRFVLYVLEHAGYSVEVAVTGMDGLKALDRELFDVVLLDVNLPDVGGLDVLAAGRSLQTDSQFIMVTGDDAADTAVEAMKLGAFDYITKPVGADVLL